MFGTEVSKTLNPKLCGTAIPPNPHSKPNYRSLGRSSRDGASEDDPKPKPSRDGASEEDSLIKLRKRSGPDALFRLIQGALIILTGVPLKGSLEGSRALITLNRVSGPQSYEPRRHMHTGACESSQSGCGLTPLVSETSHKAGCFRICQRTRNWSPTQKQTRGHSDSDIENMQFKLPP